MTGAVESLQLRREEMVQDADTPTVGEALRALRERLAPDDSAALDARLLLQHTLQVGHSYLISHRDAPLTAEQWQICQTLVARAQCGEPIPYITGEAPFYGRDFSVSPSVLIPRPETEELVQHALAWARSRPIAHVVDVGTGSGCLAVTLAAELPSAHISATDVSPDALLMARSNASRHQVAERLTFYQGDLLGSVPGPIDLIVANLPYVTDGEWTSLPDGVKFHEPALALRGGPDGLVLIRRLLQQSALVLASGGAVMLEIGWQQGEAARQAAEQHFSAATVTLLPDLAGRDRIVIIQT